jgi:hypothetical protein
MRKGLRINLALCAAIAFALAVSQPSRAGAASAPVAVDAAIVLASDVSRSIDDDEFALERRGYADAIQSQQLLDAISTGPHGACFRHVEWAGDGEGGGHRLVVIRPYGRRAFATAMSTARALVSRPDRDRRGVISLRALLRAP